MTAPSGVCGAKAAQLIDGDAAGRGEEKGCAGPSRDEVGEDDPTIMR